MNIAEPSAYDEGKLTRCVFKPRIDVLHVTREYYGNIFGKYQKIQQNISDLF